MNKKIVLKKQIQEGDKINNDTKTIKHKWSDQEKNRHKHRQYITDLVCLDFSKAHRTGKKDDCKHNKSDSPIK